MGEVRDLSVLSLSFYGAGLARPDAQFSGALDRQKDYAEGLRRYTVLVPSSEGALAVADGPLSVQPLPARGAIGFALRACRRAVALHRADPFDILMIDAPHLGAIPGLWLKLRLGIPLIVHCMADMVGNPWYRGERPSNILKHAFMKLALRVADVCRVSTNAEVARLTGMGYERESIVNVPFYIDRAAFEAALGSNGEPARGKRALYVGRVGHQKDIPTLLRAFARVRAAHPDALLTIAGDGPLRPACERLSGQLGLDGRVSFIGAVPHGQIAGVYREASVFVMPSLYEGTCMVLHEAAAARLPIVATETAGAIDFITRDGIGGWLVPVRDEVRMAEALDRAFSDPSMASAKGEQARKRLDDFSRERALQCWRQMLERAARPSPRAHEPGDS